MKKILLSLTAILAASSMSAKTVLTEIPAQYQIPESGEVSAWAWLSAELTKGHEVINGTDTTYVTDFDYTNASAFDYVVISLDECTAGYKVILVDGTWNIKPEAEFSAGTTLAAIDLKSEAVSAISNAMAALVIQPTSDGIMKIKEIAYVSADEYKAMKAEDDAKERYIEKTSATNWTVELTDNDASSWESPGWFGDQNLDVLYKNVVIEIGSSTAVSRICVQTLPNYTVHEFFVAPTNEAVKVVFPITAEENGIGQVAVCNRNITKFNVDSVTGILKEWTDAMTVNVNKVYYTSKEETSTFTPAPEVEGSWIKFDSTMICTAGAIAAKYTSPLAGFDLSVTDTDGKISIDVNTAQFGIAPGVTIDETTALPIDTIAGNAVKFTHRMKVGGKSSSKNILNLNIPADGVLTIAVRTASSSATDRKMVVKQNGEELFNDIIMEGMSVKFTDGETSVSSYPMVHMPVKQGTVEVSYPVGAINFYAFGFGYGYYVHQESEPEPEPEPEPIPDDEDGLVLFADTVALSWGATNVSGAKLADVTGKVTLKVSIETTTGEWWQFKFVDTNWAAMNLGGKEFFTANDGAYSWSAGTYTYSFDLTDEQLAAAKNGMIVQGGINAGELRLIKVVAIVEGGNAISSINEEAKSFETYNLAGQRATGKGLLIKNGKVILVK